MASNQTFIGFNEEYDKQLESQGYTKDGAVTNENIAHLDYDNIEPLSDEMLLILRQTRHINNPCIVYMQSDEEFYDEFYNRSNKEEEVDELYEEATQIRRLYRSYSKYLNAVFVRGLYIDRMMDKYGGEENYLKMQAIGCIREWLPPVPVFAKTSNEYELYLNGTPIIGDTELDEDLMDDLFNTMIEEREEELGKSLTDISVKSSVLTDIKLIRTSESLDESYNVPWYSNSGQKIGTVSANDLSNLQSMFNNWYKDDGVPKINTSKNAFFSETAESIERDWYTDYLDMRGKLSDIINYEPEDADPNEMVIDPKTDRPMTRVEYQKRQFIRIMEDGGWSGPKLMRVMNVGTRYEQNLEFKKQQRREQGKKVGKTLTNAILGNNVDSVDVADSIEDLKGMLFND